MKRYAIPFLLIAVFILSGCPKPPVIPVEVDNENMLYARAERSFKSGNSQRALFDYEEYLAQYPRGRFVPSAMMKKGKILTKHKDYVAARQTYQAVIDRYRSTVYAQEAMVEVLATFYLDGAYDEVISLADPALSFVSSKSHVTRVNILLGEAHMAKGFPAKAVEYYASAYQFTGHNDSGTVIKLEEAVRMLSTADIVAILNQTEDSLVKEYLIFQLGLNHAEENNYEEAIKVFTEFTRLYPDHPNSDVARDMIRKFERIPAYSRETIGCLLPLSGPYKRYGEKALKGIELALGQYGIKDGKLSMNIVIKDTGSDPEKAVAALEELAQENVASIIGPIITAGRIAAIAQERKIPIVVLTQKEGITDIGDFVFRNYITPSMQVNAVVSHAIESLGLKRFAILYPEEVYGTAYMQLFWDEVMSYGGKVAGVEPYYEDQTDFSEPIKKLVGRFYNDSGRKNQSIVDFDAIFIPDVPDKVGLIIPQLAFYDVENVYYLGTSLWYSDQLIGLAGKFLNHSVFPVGFHPENPTAETRMFVEKFRDTFDETPGYMEAVAYDTARILFNILRKSKSRYRSDIKNQLLEVGNFQGVTGLTSFDKNGDVRKKPFLLRVENGRFVEVGDI